MKFNTFERTWVFWALFTLIVLVLLLQLDISRQRQALQLESRVVYEYVYERALINEVILHSFVELVENDYDDRAAITRYSREIRDHYPHIRQMQIYQRVDPDQRLEHEQAMRELGFADYKIHHASSAFSEAAPNIYSGTQAYPIIFAEPAGRAGETQLGEDGYGIRVNQSALIQSSYYLNIFATDAYPLEDGSLGYRLMHGLDNHYTDSDETRFIVSMVLSVDELLPPQSHISLGMDVQLRGSVVDLLASRQGADVSGGWLLPVVEEVRNISRFGQNVQLVTRKQLLWSQSSWPFGLIILLFSFLSYLMVAAGQRQRQAAEQELLILNRQLAEERDLLEQRVMARTQELVVRNSELRQQVKENRQLTEKILDVQEAERRNIARELHDELGQSLTAIRTDARLIQRYSGSDPNSLVNISALAIDTTAQRIYGVTYALMRALRPSALDDLGLVDALHQCIDSLNLERQGLTLHLSFKGALNELPEQIGIHCFRLVQEGLNNVVKYAHAENIWLSLVLDTEGATSLRVCIEDDGVGFDTKAKPRGFGLIGMRERVLALRGSFELVSRPDQGTRIELSFPVPGFDVERLSDVASGE